MNFPILAEIDGGVIFIIIALVGAAIKAVVEKIQAAKKPGPEAFEDHSEDAYEAYRQGIIDRQVQLAQPPPLPPVSAPVRVTPPVKKTAFALPTVRRPVLTAAEKAALEQVAKRGGLSTPRRREPSAVSGIRALLSTPQAARQAIVLREILGPPGGR